MVYPGFIYRLNNINLVGSSSDGKAGSAWGVRNTQGLLHRVMNSCPPCIQSMQTRGFRL